MHLRIAALVGVAEALILVGLGSAAFAEPAPDATATASPVATPAPTVTVAAPAPAPSPTIVVNNHPEADPLSRIVNIVVAVGTVIGGGAALAAVLVSIWSRDRANITGRTWAGGGSSRAPRVEVRFRNLGPLTATDLVLSRKAPGERAWSRVGGLQLPEPFEPHTDFVFWAPIGSRTDKPRTEWTAADTWTCLEPIRGRWRWRLQWPSTPNPRRQAQSVARVRVGREPGAYLANG